MCGIFCSVQNKNINCLECLHFNEPLLRNRGPDLQYKLILNHTIHDIILAGYVLWLQGPYPIEQPFSKDQTYLLYNGDIFGGKKISKDEIMKQGDTVVLFNILSRAKSVLQSLKRLEGPYSLIFVHDNKIYFARDSFGRRSLLIGFHKDHLVITSVCRRDKDYSFIELPCIGLFVIDFSNKIETIELYPWNISSLIIKESVTRLEEFLKVKITIIYENFHQPIQIHSEPKLLTSLEPFLINSDPKIAYAECLKDLHWIDLVNELYNKLKDAVRVRASTQPTKWQNSIGVLFSGGLDCTIIAALIHQTIPIENEIHLFNVAFEKDNCANFSVPDRQTAFESLKELQHLYPKRTWKLFVINITQHELQAKCREHITHLINPLESILDESLGCALWFASRGYAENMDKSTSTCRLLFVGMGADELFGGYTRHKNAFKRQSWIGLSQELEQDWNNLPHRNLARDDRVISDHGRQVRTPYLDEKVVKFISNLPVWDRCFLTEQLKDGIGDKLLLRLLAFKLGFKEVPFFKKRALQFGCRIANSKENGKDVSSRLKDLN